MAKDYSKLKNLKIEEIIYYDNSYDYEKEIEEKYSKFLDWLIEDIEKKESLNPIIDLHQSTFVPYSFLDLLFPRLTIDRQQLYSDINLYLKNKKIDVIHFNDGRENKIIYRLSCSNQEYYNHKNKLRKLDEEKQQKIDIDTCKSNIADMSRRIFDIELENSSILKKLEEQIQLNSKLCERIFEMKEEKFKNEKIDL
jgi:hypothetical protein